MWLRAQPSFQLELKLPDLHLELGLHVRVSDSQSVCCLSVCSRWPQRCHCRWPVIGKIHVNSSFGTLQSWSTLSNSNTGRLVFNGFRFSPRMREGQTHVQLDRTICTARAVCSSLNYVTIISVGPLSHCYSNISADYARKPRAPTYFSKHPSLRSRGETTCTKQIQVVHV